MADCRPFALLIEPEGRQALQKALEAQSQLSQVPIIEVRLSPAGCCAIPDEETFTRYCGDPGAISHVFYTSGSTGKPKVA
eukprot:scaffold651311_cov45-Prasinocladus_malaysianus.AAC.1